MGIEKQRLDILLVERGLAPSRSKAQAMILAGQVLINDTPVDKAGTAVALDALIRIRGQSSNFVGRGGEKLDAAIEHFGLDVRGLNVLDVGSSTGGFSDCMLQRGAAMVYCVDVGKHQLDQRLRDDPRVVVREKTHARDLPSLSWEPRPNFCTIDVSFIGLRKILDPVIEVLETPFKILALVKPQFELEPEYVEKGGVVRELKHQQLAVRLVQEYAESIGLRVVGRVPSVIKGEKKGNQEYFVFLEGA